MSESKKILIVEDDKNLGFLLSTQLKANGFEVSLAMDGVSGLESFNSSLFDLCILDIMLPKRDGLSLAKEIREINSTIPFVFLTARNLKSDKITGYELGCDDYITKPFDMDELVYKINAILKRSSNIASVPQNNELQVGLLNLKVLERLVSINQKQITLSQKETVLLQLFFENPNEVISRKKLMLEAWGNDDYFTSKSLDVYLTKIRKVLGHGINLKLTNIHGYGYMLSVSS